MSFTQTIPNSAQIDIWEVNLEAWMVWSHQMESEELTAFIPIYLHKRLTTKEIC